MSIQIRPYDVVSGTRRLDLEILNSRGADSKAVTMGLILTEGLKNYNILVLYHADYLHLAGTFRASQRVHFPGSGPGQAPIF